MLGVHANECNPEARSLGTVRGAGEQHVHAGYSIVQRV